MEKVVVVGSSGHARVVIDVLQEHAQFRIAGLIDPFRTVGEELYGYRVLGGEDDLPGLSANHGLYGAIVAIGDNHVRAKVARRIESVCPELKWVSAVHPQASIAGDSTLGAGSVVMAGAVINPGCHLGRACIVNTNASLDHDSQLGDFVSLAPGVVTGGNCQIGDHAAVCIGAVLLHGMEIGADAVVGAGALVTKSIPPSVVAYGLPARVVRQRQPGDPYL